MTTEPRELIPDYVLGGLPADQQRALCVGARTVGVIDERREVVLGADPGGLPLLRLVVAIDHVPGLGGHQGVGAAARGPSMGRQVEGDHPVAGRYQRLHEGSELRAPAGPAAPRSRPAPRPGLR